MVVQAYDLETVLYPDARGQTSEWLRRGIAAAPFYERFSKAAQHLIHCIHAVPRLYNDCSLGEVEVYVGRTGEDTDLLRGRWREHFLSKKHESGMVAFRCWTDEVGAWETLAIRALTMLNNKSRLCVKNASVNGDGRLPSTPWSCIYVTWRRTPEVDLVVPQRSDVSALATKLWAAMDQDDPAVSRQQLLTGFDPISRPRHAYADVDWHPAHL